MTDVASIGQIFKIDAIKVRVFLLTI
jgi:hypothetical protein